MQFEKEIREQRRIAQEFAKDRKELLSQVPFGTELEQTRFDLDRIANPVVAVAGAYSAGKSALINALCGVELLPVGVTPTTLIPVMLSGGEMESVLVNTSEGPRKQPVTSESLHRLVTDKESPARYVVVESPRVAHIPWTWLDAPGANADIQKSVDLDLKPQDVADVCLLATSALQPLSLSDLGQLVQLSEIFPGDRLCLIITRWDQLATVERESVLRYVREMLASALPQRQIKIFSVFRGDASALNQIHEHLSATVYHHQKAQLEEALNHWKETLRDLSALMEMRELAQVKPETLQHLQQKLDDIIVESGAQLKQELHRFMAELHRQSINTLPSPHRQVEESIQAKFQEQFAPRLQAIGQRINEELMAELLKDLSRKQTSVSLVNRFLSLLEPSDPLFDWMSATQVGGVAGVGAALLAVGAATPVGWAIAGAAVIGGLLGGFIGSASTIDSADELQEKVVTPLTQKYQGHLSSAIASYRRDLAHLSRLMQKVVAIFSQGEASSYKDEQIKRMQLFIRLADDPKRKQLAARFRKIEVDRLASEIGELAEQMQREAAARQVPSQNTVAALPKIAGASSNISKGVVAALPKTTGGRSSKKR